MSSSYRRELDKWLSTMDVKAQSLLDIGGAQLPLKGRTRSWEVEQYVIADLAEPHVDSPKPEMVLDLNEEYLFTYQYDLVFCLEVMEYIWNPAEAIKNIAQLLKPGGHAWVTFQSVYPVHQPIEDDSLRYMPAGVAKLAKNAGLSIAQTIYRRPDTNFLQVFYSAEQMRAAKHEDNNFTGMIVEFVK